MLHDIVSKQEAKERESAQKERPEQQAFGVHSGWITIAGIVNLYAYPVKIKWDGILSNSDFRELVGIVAAVILVFILQLMLKNAVLAPAAAWAAYGIYAKGAVYTSFRLFRCFFWVQMTTKSAVELIDKGTTYCRKLLKTLEEKKLLKWHGTSLNDRTQYYTLNF